jgi:hypothetical protein
MCKHTDSIRAHWAAVTPEHLEAGQLWYPNARLLVSDLADEYEASTRIVAGIVAALSQQCRWATNIERARHILSGGIKPGGIPLAGLKARMILDGADPVEALGPQAYKVAAFYAALTGDDDAAVVDTWMLTAFDWHREGYGPKQYRTLAGILRNEAQANGLPTTAYQAAVWCAVRGTAN